MTIRVPLASNQLYTLPNWLQLINETPAELQIEVEEETGRVTVKLPTQKRFTLWINELSENSEKPLPIYIRQTPSGQYYFIS